MKASNASQNRRLETDEIVALQKEITDRYEKLIKLRRALPPQEVKDYELLDWNGGKVKLSSLFGQNRDLVLVHNMGRRCVYCTLWADGFIGVQKHLEDRAAFVVVSPDEPKIQKEFAASRGWTFRMLSGHGGSFIADMGYDDGEGSYLPGVSTFRLADDGKIYRLASDHFGPGDAYCSVWHFFDLLQEGDNGWEPKYKY